MSVLSRARVVSFWVLSLAIALISWRWMVLGVEGLHHAFERPLAFYAHVSLAPVALALAPFQFWTGLRTARPGLHRWMGRGYAAAILISGVGGFLMALGTEAGPVAAWGFGLLAVLWVAVTGQAVRLAMLGQIGSHRRWMIRSLALTLAAVTLRLELPILAAVLGFEAGFPLVAWLCWVPNVLVAEWVLRPRGQGAVA